MAEASTVQLNHSVVCRYSAQVPTQFFAGGSVTASAHITCSPTPPDVSNTTVILWRYDGNNRYSNIAHITSNRLALDWYLNTYYSCAGSSPYPMHVQVLNDSYHGTWGHTSGNSNTVTMYC